MYHDRATFHFSRGHVTKNQPVAIPVSNSSGGKVYEYNKKNYAVSTKAKELAAGDIWSNQKRWNILNE